MWNWISKLEELRLKGQGVVAVTVTQNTGSVPREPGAKMLVLPDGKFFGTIGGGHFEDLALKDAQECFKTGTSKIIRYPLGAKTGQCCGGVIELLFEVLNQGPEVYIFGAGHVGQALMRTLVGTPFKIHAIDERAEWITSCEIPQEVIRHEMDWQDAVSEIEAKNDKSYFIVMTHRHDTDQDIIEYLIKKPARFIGLIGSESKWARFKQRLKLKGISDDELSRVHCPVGLNLGGGKAPQEIAISVAAQLLENHNELKSRQISSDSAVRGAEHPYEDTQRPLDL